MTKARNDRKNAKSYKHILARYGLTEEAFAAMLILQSGRCAICNKPFGPSKTEGPSVDHDHNNGRTRSLLHQRCNLGLGAFLDDPAQLRAAADYIERWNLLHSEMGGPGGQTQQALQAVTW